MAHLVARLRDLPDPGLVSVALPSGERLVLIRRNGVVTALADACTHQAMPLSAGELTDDGAIECPWHGARFDRTSGRCLRGPAADDVPTYDVRIEGDQVFIEGERAAR